MTNPVGTPDISGGIVVSRRAKTVEGGERIDGMSPFALHREARFARRPSAAPALAAAPDRGDLAPFPFPCRAVVGQRDAPHGAPQGRQHTCSRQEGDRRGDRRHRERIAV